MAGVVDFDPHDPIWSELGDILEQKFGKSECQVCGAEAVKHDRHIRYEEIDMECAWREWECTKCDWEFRSLFYWRRRGEKAPRRWKVEATKANLAELMLEFRRSPFWQKALFHHRLLAQHADAGRVYVTAEEVLNFLEDIVTTQVYLDDDSRAWPAWSRE